MRIDVSRFGLAAVLLALVGCVTVEGDRPLGSQRQQARSLDKAPGTVLELTQSELELTQSELELTQSDLAKLDLSAIAIQPWRSRTSNLRGIVLRCPEGEPGPHHGVMSGDVLLSVNGAEFAGRAECVRFLRREYNTGVNRFVARWLSMGRVIERTFVMTDA